MLFYQPLHDQIILMGVDSYIVCLVLCKICRPVENVIIITFLTGVKHVVNYITACILELLQ